MQRNMQRLSRLGLFGGSVNKSPNTKILGSGATPIQMQKRHFGGYPEIQPGHIAAFLGVCIAGISIPTLATYYSYKYFQDNYQIVRKNKKTGNDLNEENFTEEYQSTRRPGKM